MKKACVILGAGASFDCASEGSQIHNEAWRPPLTIDLFRGLKSVDAGLKSDEDPDQHTHRPEFFEILNDYPGARTLSASIIPRLAAGAAGLEEVLRELAESEDRTERQDYMQIPAYIRDVITRCDLNFVQLPLAYTQLVTKLLRADTHRVLFLVLNYDTLLERALADYRINLAIHGMDDYIAKDRPAHLVKLHGSIDWFAPILTEAKTWDDAVGQSDALDAVRIGVGVAGITRFKKVQEAYKTRDVRIRWDGRNYVGYPVVTAPVGGKGPQDIVCPPDHEEAARRFLAGDDGDGPCTKFLIAGTSGLDDDLLQRLHEWVAPMSRGVPLIHLVGKSGLYKLEHTFRTKVGVFSRAQVVKYKDGFASYVSGEGIRDFADD